MDSTQKAIFTYMKDILGVEKGKRLKKEDWEKVTTLTFNEEMKFVVNGAEAESKQIKWDLYHIFRFTNLQCLSIRSLMDYTLITAGGTEAFNYKFWFDKFPKLNYLCYNANSADNHKESTCFKFLLNDGNHIYLIKNESGNEHEIEIHSEDHQVIKTFYFSNSKKKSFEWLGHLLNYIKDNKELPKDDWFNGLKSNKKYPSRKLKNTQQ